MSKKLSFLILFTLSISIFSCKKDADSTDSETIPVEINFTINSDDSYAPTNISTTNNTTNSSGNFLWKVEEPTFLGMETYTTSEINFEADRVGTYKITLYVDNDSLTKTITINKPSYLEFDRLTLENVSNTYSEIYFKVFKLESPANTTPILLYTSAIRNNVTSTSVNVGNEYWLLSNFFNRIEILDFNDPSVYYYIEFYNENDVKIASSNFYLPTFDEFSVYTNENYIYTTSPVCTGCDYIEASLNTTFSNY